MDARTSALVAASAVGLAGFIGSRNGPQRPLTAAWYGLLRKPGYTPPGPLIGGAWGVLEILLAVAGYRLLQSPVSGPRAIATGSWGFTLVGLAGYPWLFFRRKRLAASTLASGLMLASAATSALSARRIDRPAAAMTLPLLAWLAFATILSEELWRRNSRLSHD